ncbi:MAG: Gfo/Idh/MocA family oxidoreductase [Planctomycetota bacterium]
MTLRVGVCGLGFMGRTHLEGYRAARLAGAAVRVAAVADRNESKRRGDLGSGGNIDTGGASEMLFDPDEVEAFADPYELVRRADVDLVSICTHTPTHVDLAVAALENGKHVFVEKPVALSVAEVERLVAARDASGKECFPNMCMRHWPGWDDLRERIEKAELGELRSLALKRLSPAPGWGAAFYGDTAKTGGALFDLHVHDVDLVHWILGAPSTVTSVGTREHVFTQYRFEGRPELAVTAEGGWDLPADFPFHMGYQAVFERGAVVFDSNAANPLVETRRGEAPRVLPMRLGTGYEHEIRHLVQSLAKARTDPRLDGSLDDAVAVTRTLEAEARSLASGRPESVGAG